MRRILRTPAECAAKNGNNAIELKTLTACSTVIVPRAVFILETMGFYIRVTFWLRVKGRLFITENCDKINELKTNSESAK